MIIVQDVFVVTHRVSDASYDKHDQNGDTIRMTPEEAVAHEYNAEVGDAIELLESSTDEELHWSRKVTHTSG